MDVSTIESWENLKKYAEEWSLIRRADLTWKSLRNKYRKEKGHEKPGRFRIAEDLMKRLDPKVCCTQLAPLRDALRRHKMASHTFYDIVAAEGLTSTHPVMAVAAIYIAMYYSSVSGQFLIENFEGNYQSARNY